MVQTLNKVLRNYLFDFKINIKNIDTEYYYFPKQKIYYQEEFLNYYFIIKNKIKNNLNIAIEYYDKKELVKKEINFDKNNIISENDKDIISKIIIGNILNNTELSEEKNIELSKRYQVLSKYTSLYAEVENENSTKNEMLIVEQKNYEEYFDNESDNNNKWIMASPLSFGLIKKRGRKRQCLMLNIETSDSDDESDSEVKVRVQKNVKKRNVRKKAKKFQVTVQAYEEENVKSAKKCEMNISDEGEENNDNNAKEVNNAFDVKEIALTQNIINGNWSINFHTQFVIDSNDEIYNKIKNYVEKLNIKENKENIIVTILVLYYLKNNKDINQTEYILIINKGLQYLQNLGIKELLYENIKNNIN